MRRVLMLAATLALAEPAAAADDAGRFTVRGEVHPLSHSADRRFSLRAELRQTPATASANGRYALKAVNVPEAACDPAVDLFANGFEGS